MNISDLQDDDIRVIGSIVGELNRKWSRKSNNQRNLMEMCKEAEEAAFKKNILIKMHLTDLLVGGVPTLEVIGKISPSEEKYGFDHEKKRHDVLKSKERNEDFLGQKETPDSRRQKKAIDG